MSKKWSGSEREHVSVEYALILAVIAAIVLAIYTLLPKDIQYP